MLLCRLVGLRPFIITNGQVQMDEAQSKSTQLWTIEQQGNGVTEPRYNTNGSLRPIYLLQAQQPPPTLQRLRQVHPLQETPSQHQQQHYSRGRSSSPPLRLAQIKGVTRNTRGQSSSPPEYTTRRVHNPRVFAGTDASSDSSQSYKSSPRRAWHQQQQQRDFHSGIPVPVPGEINNKTRFRRRHHLREDLSASQPMIALPRHYHEIQSAALGKGGGVGSAPVVHHSQRKSRTKSPSPTHFSVDKFSISQDSGINHQTTSSSSGSGSESSDYYTPPAEPYLSHSNHTNTNITNNNNGEQTIKANIRPEDSFDHSDRSETPQPPIMPSGGQPVNRERFINLEDHEESTSDFDEDVEDVQNIGNIENIEDLEEKKEGTDETDFVRSLVYQKLHDEHIMAGDPPFREKIAEKRLSKSHADLSEVKKFNRKTVNSAPLVKHLKNLENNRITSRFDEESRISDAVSLSQSQTDIRSLEMKSNQSIQSSQSSELTVRSMNSLNLSQKDLDLNDSQTNLQYPEEVVPEQIKYPDIIRKKSLPSKPRIELKRRPSNIPTKVPIFPDSFRTGPRMKDGLSEVISQLESPEWEQSVKGLQGLVKLVRNHQDTVENQLHAVCVLLGKHVKNLRSQVARAACLAAGEMFQTHKKALEQELEELTVPLLQRTADTNKFLRADANGALDQMCLNMTASRSVTVLATRGATHHNAVVRCATARLLSELVQRLGSNRIYQLPREIRDKILATGANMLMEGSLETRKHAKNMFSELVNHPQFQRSMTEAVAPTVLRNITKQLNNLK